MMSAEELGILSREHVALIEVLRRLEKNEIPYSSAFPDEIPDTLSFNMATWRDHCGMVCCIGGLAETIMGHEFSDISHARLNELFHALKMDKDMDLRDIMPSDAVKALRNYLTTGDPRWNEIFPDAEETPNASST